MIGRQEVRSRPLGKLKTNKMEKDNSVKNIFTWLATVATLTFTLPGVAAQDNPRLDTLFEKLKSTREVTEAREIEQEIWNVWLVSGDDRVDAIMAKGLRAMAYRDHDAALGAFNEIVQLLPSFAEGLNKRATIFFLMGNHQASTSDIETTLALEPRHFGALSGLGLIFLMQGEVNPYLPGVDSHIKELREQIKGRKI